MKRTILFTIAVLFLLVGCSTGEKNESSSGQENKEVTNTGDFKSYTSETEKNESTNPEKYKTIEGEDAKDLLSNSEVTVIDVRKPEAYSGAHIPNAQNIPLSDLEARLSELDKTGTYLMVCKTGKTSESAYELLAQNGFNNLYNLSGGMDGWTGDVVKE